MDLTGQRTPCINCSCPEQCCLTPESLRQRHDEDQLNESKGKERKSPKNKKKKKDNKNGEEKNGKEPNKPCVIPTPDDGER